MIQNRQLAKRYAKAFLHDELDRDAFEAMIGEVESLIDCMRTDVNVREYFTSPLYPEEAKLKTVRNMAKKLKFTGYTLSLLEMLINKNRMALLEIVFDELQKMSDQMHKRVRVRVTTAVEPSPEDLREMSEKIGLFFDSEILVERRIDPSIIGGFLLEGDGKLIDMSVMGQIRRALSEV